MEARHMQNDRLALHLAVLAMLAIAATKAPAPDTGGTATAPPKTSPP